MCHYNVRHWRIKQGKGQGDRSSILATRFVSNTDVMCYLLNMWNDMLLQVWNYDYVYMIMNEMLLCLNGYVGWCLDINACVHAMNWMIISMLEWPCMWIKCKYDIHVMKCKYEIHDMDYKYDMMIMISMLWHEMQAC